MEQYLIDTNVVSDYLSASFPAAGMALMDTAIDAVPNVSIITQIELLCWNTDETTTQNVKGFISDSVVLDISPDVIAQYVAIRKGKKNKNSRCHHCSHRACPRLHAHHQQRKGLCKYQRAENYQPAQTVKHIRLKENPRSSWVFRFYRAAY
jgi:hypothetical protein